MASYRRSAALGQRAQNFLDADNELLFSAIVGFEIAVKHSLGKLKPTEPPRTFIDNRIRNNALTPSPITLAHAVRVAELPFHHRDPFDRLLVAQTLEEDLLLLSADDTPCPLTVSAGFGRPPPVGGRKQKRRPSRDQGFKNRGAGPSPTGDPDPALATG